MDKTSSVLSTKTRINLPKSEFALPKQKKPGKPGEGAYPIPDARHARVALSRVSHFGTSAEKAKVRAKVQREFPGIDVTKKAEAETEMDKIAAALALGTALADQDLLGLRKEAMDTAARLMLMSGVGPAPDDGFSDNDINELGKIAQALDVGAAVDEFQRQRAMRTLRHGGVGALGGAAGGAGLGALIQALRGGNVGEGVATGAGLGGMAGLYGGMIHGGLSKTPRAKKVEKKEHEKTAFDLPGGYEITGDTIKEWIQQNPEAAASAFGGVAGGALGTGIGALTSTKGRHGRGALVGGLVGAGLGAGAGYGGGAMAREGSEGIQAAKAEMEGVLARGDPNDAQQYLRHIVDALGGQPKLGSASLGEALELQKTAMVGTLQRLMTMEKTGLDIPGVGNVDVGAQIESLKQLIQENPEAAGAIMGGVGGAGVGALAAGKGHRGKGALIGGGVGAGLGGLAGNRAEDLQAFLEEARNRAEAAGQDIAYGKSAQMSEVTRQRMLRALVKSSQVVGSTTSVPVPYATSTGGNAGFPGQLPFGGMQPTEFMNTISPETAQQLSNEYATMSAGTPAGVLPGVTPAPVPQVKTPDLPSSPPSTGPANPGYAGIGR